MKYKTHIRQITTEGYVVVIENGEQALIDFPELFEEVNTKIPTKVTYLIYQRENNQE